MSNRTILNNRGRERNEIRDLLQSIVTAELLRPSKELWLISPWISKIELLDNSVGAFWDNGAVPRFGSLWIVDFLVFMASTGCRVTVVTRPKVSQAVVDELNRKSGPELGGRLRILERQQLHTKGLIGDEYSLSGSMNFTYMGVNINDELITLSTDLNEVARLRTACRDQYGEAE